MHEQLQKCEITLVQTGSINLINGKEPDENLKCEMDAEYKHGGLFMLVLLFIMAGQHLKLEP